jgi:hypothetical protein
MLFWGMREREPKPVMCVYCEDYAPVPAVETVNTIDGRSEPVCNMHNVWVNKVGLVSNGATDEQFVDLVDYMRDVIKDNTFKHFQNTLVNIDKL